MIWAFGEVNKFIDRCKSLLFRSDDYDDQTIARCLEIAKLHCKVLEQKGLSFAFLLDLELVDEVFAGKI